MTITTRRERGDGNGWLFDIDVLDDRGAKRAFAVRLAWADYNLWSPDGSHPPELVAKAVLRFLLDREPALELAERFDAARVRRRYPEADETIPGLIGTV